MSSASTDHDQRHGNGRDRLRQFGLTLIARALGSTRAARPASGGTRLLLIRPDHLGDVLLTSPAIALLRKALPDAHLTYLVGPWGLATAEHGPAVDRLAVVAFPGFARSARLPLLAPYVRLARLARQIRRERYDVAVVFRPDHWWGALLTQLAGISCRVGTDTATTGPFLTAAQPFVGSRHAAEQALAVARQVVAILGGRVAEPVDPAPVFHVRPEDTSQAQAWLEVQSLTDCRYAVLHPSAGAGLKSWPVERWAQVARGLVSDEMHVVLSGGPDDADLLEAVQRHLPEPPLHRLVGQPLGMVAAVLARSLVAVGPDNGPLHLAAAVGTPTVRLYGPASPVVFGPWPPSPQQRVLLHGDLPCVSCGHLEKPPCDAVALPPCMLGLSAELVASTARDLAEGRRPGHAMTNGMERTRA